MLASADAGGAVRRQRCESMARPAAAALGWLGQDGVLASSERPAISVRCGERRGSLGGTTGSSWRCGSDHCKPVPWSGRRLLRVVLDLVDGAGWLWFLSRLGVGGATIVLLAVRPVVDPRLAVALAKCCGGGSVNLLGRCCPIPGGVVRCDARMKILLGFRWTGGDGTRGCHPPHWRRSSRRVRHVPRSLGVVAVSGRKPRFGFGSAQGRRHRRRFSVGSFVLETWLVP